MRENAGGSWSKRCELLNWLSENRVHFRTTMELLTPMEGKTDEEKEQIAEEALKRMKALPPEELAKLQVTTEPEKK